MSTTFTWDGTSNFWNSNHWGRGGVSPQWPGDTGSTTSDAIVCTTSTIPTSGPNAAITVGSVTLGGFSGNFPANEGSNLTVSSTGTLTVGNSGTGAMYSVFAGVVTAGCLVRGASINSSSIMTSAGGTLSLNNVLTAAMGNFTPPTAAQLIMGQSCGTGGGTSIAGTQYVPAAASVLQGVSTGTTTGTYYPSPAASVLSTQNFGAGSNGTTGGTQGTYVLPPVSSVISTQRYGVGNATSGTYDVSQVAAANIVYGYSIGGVAGTYYPPSSQGGVLTTTTYGVANATSGTYNACPQANAIHTGTPYMGVTGSLVDGSQYVPGAQDVYAGVSTGTTVGTLHASTLHSGAGAPGSDLTAGTLVAGTTVDDVTGTAADMSSLAAGQTAILNAVGAITRNTARSMPVTGTWFVRPVSGTTIYNVDLYLYNLAGQLEDPDNDAVRIDAGSTAGGTDCNGNLSATSMTQVSTGHYSVGYSVAGLDQAMPHPQGAVYFSFSWTITESVGGANTAVAGADAAVVQVQDAEQLATLNDIDGKATAIANLVQSGGAGDLAAILTAAAAVAGLVETGGAGDLAAMRTAVEAAPTAAAVAQAVFLVDLAGAQDAAPENSLCTVCLAGLHSSVAGTTWTIRKTDGTTKVAKTVAISAEAAPIVGIT